MPETIRARGDDDCAEGIVHGHIHNYDNMTYIHGHLHHTSLDGGANSQAISDLANANAAPKQETKVPSNSSSALPCAVPTAMSNEASAGSNMLNESCKNYSDCQHFEIINYHKTESSTSKSRACDSHEKPNTAHLPLGSSIFNDDFLLLPPKKRKILQNNHKSGSGSNDFTKKAPDCECNPKILEVCCDVLHTDSLKSSSQKDKDMVKYTDLKSDLFLQPQTNGLGHHNGSGSTSNQIAGNNDPNAALTNQYFNEIPEVPEINCDLTCAPNYYNNSSFRDSQNDPNDSESEEEVGDIFEKFCKECLNLGQEQKINGTEFDIHSNPHHAHHHSHKNSFDTPLSTTSTSSADTNASIKVEKNFRSDEQGNPHTLRATAQNVTTASKTITDAAKIDLNAHKGLNANVIPSTDDSLSHTKACHDHIVNSQMDLKILDDLCNISSLYEFPLANHLNHQNHSHDHSPKENTTSKQHETQTQSINLLESSLRGTTSQSHKPSYSHHHHIIQLHPHKPNCKTDCMPMVNDNYNLNFTNTIPGSIHYNNKNYSNERSTIQEDPVSNPEIAKFHHSEKPIDWNSIGQENNTINFNWSFKSEENSLKCKWDQCPETYSTLFDLQKHMLRDHVGAVSSPDLSCYWEDCNFKSEDTCSLINHINSDHGINFGMKVADPISLLEHREVNHNNHHHCDDDSCHDLHCHDIHCHDMHLGPNVNSIAQCGTQHAGPCAHDHGTSQPCVHDHNTFQKPLPISDDTQDGNTLGTFACKWGDCTEVLDSAEALTTHLEQVHLTRGKSEYQCQWEGCRKKFTQRQKLVRHLKVHSGYKPYKCSVCSKCFSSEDTLTQHMRIHSGEKPFECPICGKKFTVSSSLKIHIRTHTGEKPLQCKICGKRFNESSNLSKHMKTHQKKYKCSYCARSFDTIDRFNTHQNKCAKAHQD